MKLNKIRGRNEQTTMRMESRHCRVVDAGRSDRGKGWKTRLLIKRYSPGTDEKRRQHGRFWYDNNRMLGLKR